MSMVVWLVGWLNGYLGVWLVEWLVGSMVGMLVGRLVANQCNGRLVGWWVGAVVSVTANQIALFRPKLSTTKSKLTSVFPVWKFNWKIGRNLMNTSRESKRLLVVFIMQSSIDFLGNPPVINQITCKINLSTCGTSALNNTALPVSKINTFTCYNIT